MMTATESKCWCGGMDLGSGVVHLPDCAERTSERAGQVAECIYCGATETTQATPAVDDDAAWAALAAEHDPAGCEWVETRAHRVVPR